MLIDRRNSLPHQRWIAFVVIATLVSVIWYVAAAWNAPRLPGGSSLPGFTFGVLGGLIILFEFLLWFKKKFRTWRIGRAQTWMQAHIWLGLLTVPLLVLHCGFRLGGQLSTVLMVLFLVVIASGIWGLVVQQFLPRKMFDSVPAETIHSQIDHVVAQFREDARHLVAATCGISRDDPDFEVISGENEERAGAGSYLVVGAVRAAGFVQGKVLQTQVPQSPVPHSEPLREFFVKAVDQYLQYGNKTPSPLMYPGKSAVMFLDLRTKLHPDAHSAVDALESLCDQRRQLDLQSTLHFWMHNWLLIHLPLSVALVVLMLVHVFVALKYL